MEIAELIIKKSVKSGAKTPEDLARIKREFAKKYKKSCLSNIELLKAYHKLSKNRSVQKSEFMENLLKTRPVRSLSGIVNVSVLTKPYPCPGKCIYCPTQKGAPKSYLKNEPAVMRAILTKYDPEKQARTRILALKLNGHPTDKIELRIIGGTWSFYPKKYQNWFIKKCFDACNGKRSKNLKQAQKINEKAKRRIIGLSVETRPDYITIAEIKR
jgi:elongator complex protein 3